MTITTLMSLFVASGFVIVTLFGAHYANRIFKVRMAHEEKVYEQRAVLIDLLINRDKEAVDEAIAEWLAEHLQAVREDVREELERTYHEVLKSVLDTYIPQRPTGGSHDQPQRPV